MTPQQRQRTPWSLEGRLKPMGRTGLQTSMHPRGREPPDRTPTPTRWHLAQQVTTQEIPPGSKPPANSQYLSFEVHLTTVTDGFNDKYNHNNDAFDAQVHSVLFPEHWKTVGTVCTAAPVPLAPNTVLGWMMDEVNEGMDE